MVGSIMESPIARQAVPALAGFMVGRMSAHRMPRASSPVLSAAMTLGGNALGTRVGSSLAAGGLGQALDGSRLNAGWSSSLGARLTGQSSLSGLLPGAVGFAGAVLGAYLTG